MSQKPNYEELQQKLVALEEENKTLKQDLPLSSKDRLKDILDVGKLQSIMDDFYNLTGMVTAILDLEGVVLEATGWRDLCTCFHRQNPESSKNCTESDLYLVKNIKEGEFIEYQCKNGLWDVATPLYIGDRHMGNIYTGQFFYHEDVVDEDQFLRQAEKYGFDKEAYMSAFRSIPRYSREEIHLLMGFLVKFTSYISTVNYSKMKLQHEIAERKRTEIALETQKNRLDYIVKSMNVGTWEWNVQSGETIFNERWANIIGYTMEELAPVSIDTWVKYCHSDDMRESERLLDLCFSRQSDFYECECRMKHKDGRWIWVLDRGRVTTWTEEGKPEWMFGTHQDITERKEADLAREELQLQLNQAQKMESVGRLAGGVAHDFNNMLGVILGHTELAMEEIKDSGEALPNSLKEIQKAASHSATLTRQLLAFARKETISPKVLNLNNAVDEQISMLQRIIGENIDLMWIPDVNIASVKIDPNQINQVLTNLCVNARDAIGEIGKITIETGTARFDKAYCKDHFGYLPGNYVMLAVSDNGSGMDHQTLSNIFEPFFTTKALGKGTGLGLATVYGVVKQNNGFVNVYSEPGQGTTFKIYLPEHDKKEPSASDSENEKPFYTGNNGTETILLVEDEPAILKMTSMMLEKEKYKVLKTSNPEEAIDFAYKHKNEIHLLITDVVMPDMTGLELAKRVQALNPDIKCLFMSGYTANVIAHHGVLENGLHFIQKPFSIKNLHVKIREILNDSQSS